MSTGNVTPISTAREPLITSGQASQLSIRLSNIKGAVNFAHDALATAASAGPLADAHGVLDLARGEIERVQDELGEIEVAARSAECEAEEVRP